MSLYVWCNECKYNHGFCQQMKIYLPDYPSIKWCELGERE